MEYVALSLYLLGAIPVLSVWFSFIGKKSFGMTAFIAILWPVHVFISLVRAVLK